MTKIASLCAECDAPIGPIKTLPGPDEFHISHGLCKQHLRQAYEKAKLEYVEDDDDQTTRFERDMHKLTNTNKEENVMKERMVIITTEYRGVFCGYTPQTNDEIFASGRAVLRQGKMAIYWGTEKGLMQLANTGPTSTSKISEPADLEVNKVTGVFVVSDQARSVWDEA